jgi:hypothetical protein
MGAHLGIEKYDSRVGTPRPSQPDMIDAGFGRELAPVEHKSAVLFGIMLAVRRNVSAVVGGAMDFELVEERFSIAENEIDIPLDVAIRELLARGYARISVRIAVPARGV